MNDTPVHTSLPASGRPLWRRMLGWLGFAVLALLTMELAARIDDKLNQGAPITRNYEFDQLFAFDGKVVRGTPHASYMKWSLNSIGLRGPEPDFSKPRPRVLAYGASEVFGIYESIGREFPRQLEDELRVREKSDRVEVVNAGIPGMRIGSGAEFLRELGERAKPKVVVLYPTPTHYLGVTQPHCGRPERAPSAMTQSTWPASRLKAKLVDRLKEALPKPLVQSARKAAIAWATRSTPGVEQIVPSTMLALEFDLRCTLKTVRALGAKAVLVTHPNRFGATPTAADDAFLTGWNMQYPAYTEKALLSIEAGANQVIRDIAKQENVALVDASAVLGGHGDLFADHAHFNDEGAKRMAKLLADAVQPLLVDSP